jgi:hypothetical protein
VAQTLVFAEPRIVSALLFAMHPKRPETNLGPADTSVRATSKDWSLSPTMNSRLLALFGVGILMIGGAIFFIFSSTKGRHLELKGEILKIRTGALGDDDSIAVLDLRLENISDIPFMVRQVEVTVDKDGGPVTGVNISKSDLKQLFQYNRFLGDQYNDSLTIHDTIPPRGKVDRMVATRFDIKNKDLEASKTIHVSIQDMDGPLFETSKAIK